MAEANDEILLAAARNGDKNALEALLLRFQPRVYRFGMKRSQQTARPTARGCSRVT
jgi:hypothetical protein